MFHPNEAVFGVITAVVCWPFERLLYEVWNPLVHRFSSRIFHMRVDAPNDVKIEQGKDSAIVRAHTKE